MEIRHLRAFVALAEDLHFTRAAQRLHLTQQALSNQIRQLEAELGTQLVQRTTRNVALTPPGQTLLEHAVPILRAIDGAIAATRDAASGETGSLRVAYAPTLALDTLPAIVERTHERLPALQLSTVMSWTHQAILGLQHEHFDLALAHAPVLPDGIEAVTLRHEPLGVILGAGNRVARHEVVPIDALNDYMLVLWPREHSPGYFDRIVEAFPVHYETGRIHLFQNFSPQGFLDDTPARMEIAAGRAFQLAFAAHYDPPPDGFVWRPLEPAPTIRTDLMMRAGVRSAQQRRFVELAIEVATERDWLRTADTLQPTA